MRGVNAMILQQLGSQIPLIPQVAQYLIAAGGKRLRPLLCVASARMLGDTSSHSHELAAGSEEHTPE
ncbi:MAG TPA: farnesyltranstransferase, partial [Rhodospirillaceae bacterium]|nr:farnesyltranstransferase [Rhodospirillaceae bacterium]